MLATVRESTLAASYRLVAGSRLSSLLREVAGSHVLAELERVFNEAVREEISKGLKTDRLEVEFELLAERFAARLSSVLAELGFKLLGSVNRRMVDSIREAEVEVASEIASAIRSSGYGRGEDLIRALAVMVEYDLWLLDRVSRHSLQEFTFKVFTRAREAALGLTHALSRLHFAVAAALAALMGIIREYRPENLDYLVSQALKYAEEVDLYMDTLDVILDDEAYKEASELGAIEGA